MGTNLITTFLVTDEDSDRKTSVSSKYHVLMYILFVAD